MRIQGAVDTEHKVQRSSATCATVFWATVSLFQGRKPRRRATCDCSPDSLPTNESCFFKTRAVCLIEGFSFALMFRCTREKAACQLPAASWSFCVGDHVSCRRPLFSVRRCALGLTSGEVTK